MGSELIGLPVLGPEADHGGRLLHIRFSLEVNTDHQITLYWIIYLFTIIDFSIINSRKVPCNNQKFKNCFILRHKISIFIFGDIHLNYISKNIVSFHWF